MNTQKLLTIQRLSSEKGRLERMLPAASPSEKVILQIQITTLSNQLSLESRGLRQEEWRVC